MEKPNIEFKGIKYQKIGCRNCGEGDHIWNIYSDKYNFVAKCGTCGHTLLLITHTVYKIFQINYCLKKMLGPEIDLNKEKILSSKHRSGLAAAGPELRT